MLQWVDIAIVSVIGLSVLTGLFRGFVKELVALCVWVLAFWFGYTYCQSLDPWLTSYVKDQSARTAIGFVIIFFAVLLIGGVINALLSFILKRAGLSGTDKTLGMVFGFLRGVFIVALIMVAIKMTSLPYVQYSKESILYAHFEPIVGLIYDHLPEFITKMKSVDKSDQIIDTVPST
jgi:membrane protein required for colicin V production